jgi:cbb3-type cytochrome oxidase subunit 3
MKSIADVVSASGLAGYAEVALVIFVLVFIAVGVRALATNRAALERAANLPFDDDPAPRPTHSSAAPKRPA